MYQEERLEKREEMQFRRLFIYRYIYAVYTAVINAMRCVSIRDLLALAPMVGFDAGNDMRRSLLLFWKRFYAAVQ